MTEFEKVLMERDGLTAKQAEKERKNASKMLNEIVNNGGGYDEVEELILDEYGLEMDYLMDLL